MTKRGKHRASASDTRLPQPRPPRQASSQVQQASGRAPSSYDSSDQARWKKPRMNFSDIRCPAHKCIPGTDFYVDAFLYTAYQPNLTTNHFLSHFHADHYGGITKKWKNGRIYCSLPTANLVRQQLG